MARAPRSALPVEHSEKSDGKNKSASAVTRAFVQITGQCCIGHVKGK